MKNILRLGVVSALTLNLAMTNPIYVGPAQSNDFFKSFSNGVEKNIKTFKKTVRENDKLIEAVIVVGAGAVIGGALGSTLGGEGIPVATGAAIGLLLVSASPEFQKEMADLYGNDWKWSGCTSCGTRRVITVPGRKISTAQRNQVSQKVKDDVKNIQTALKQLNLYNIGIDGDYGPGTKKAVKLFQASLGAEQTATLTADQRVALFSAAADAGFVRDGYENRVKLSAFPVDQSTGNAIVQPVSIEHLIPDYKLANSQFRKFSDRYLTFGELTSVKQSSLKHDGMVEILVAEADNADNLIVAKVEEISFLPHALSDEWVRVAIGEEGASDFVLLNTVDVFDSADEANEWVGDARKNVTLLSKLTGHHSVGQIEEPIVIALAPQAEKVEKMPVVEPKRTDEPIIIPLGAKADETVKNEGGSAENKNKQIPLVMPTENEVSNQVSIEPVSVPVEAQFDAGQCRGEVYINLKFPGGDNPISHYNITSPEGTIMMDNGDSTAYVAGECIQGDYTYKYVFVEKENDKVTKHHAREGVFKLASNSSECEINLNDPTGSAGVMCF